MESVCTQCPRACRVTRREGDLGYCRTGRELRVARIARHAFEEPPISGTRGSGTVFFVGCNLRCVFCQNREISGGAGGRDFSPQELEERMLALQEEGVHNLNLVTPSHYAEQLVPLLERLRPRLSIPVVYNCGGYERVETLRRLEGLIDIYLPDFKYGDASVAARYSGAPDYCEVALDAIGEMLRQVGEPRYTEQGLLLGGMIVRHLVLPGNRHSSITALERLAARHDPRRYLLSLMSQYTPAFALDTAYPELHRRVTTFEYESVLDRARALGFDGFLQARSSADAAFTPDFSEPPVCSAAGRSPSDTCSPVPCSCENA